MITFAQALERLTQEHAHAVVGTAAFAVFMVAYALAATPARVAGRLGSRGLKRQRSVADDGPFAALEPLIRWLGSRLSGLVPERLCRRIDERLLRAGDFLGVTAEEYVAMLLLGAAVGGGLGLYHEDTFAYGKASVWVGAALGAYVVQSRFDGEVQRRVREITHGLPYVTDLLSLGMTAGLDFPGAIRNVVARSSNRRDALTEELERVLHELSLGHTRAHALAELAARAQVPAVTEFVLSVQQAEERGSPIVAVLLIQAEVARQKRTALAEERTSKANVQMILPLFLLVVSALIVLMTPMVFKLLDAFEKMQ